MSWCTEIPVTIDSAIPLVDSNLVPPHDDDDDRDLDEPSDKVKQGDKAHSSE